MQILLTWRWKKPYLSSVSKYLKIRRDVLDTASRRIQHCVPTYPALRRDVSYATSGRNFIPVITLALNEKILILFNTISILYMESIQKAQNIADLWQFYGNLWQIKPFFEELPCI